MNYIKIENGIIIDWACGSDMYYYESQGFEATDREVVLGYDGRIYFMDENPSVPRAIQIENELIEADRIFNEASQNPIEFENHFYKFGWTSLYQSLLGLESTFYPIKIWDISGLEENAVMMSKDKLHELQNLLVSVEEPAFQLRKETISKLLKEKQSI